MIPRQTVTIGVLSDTHLPFRLAALPPQIPELFAGVDLVLHAGDVDEIAFLEPLSRIAPVYAVRGNVHPGDLSWGGRELPREVELTLANRRLVLTHGHRPGVWGWLMKGPEVVRSALSSRGDDYLNDEIIGRLRRRYPGADVVIFGHSHAVCCQTVGKTLFFNPGSVAPTRNRRASVGVLRLSPAGVAAEIIPL